MNTDLKEQITARLTRDHKAKQQGEWLRQIECPSCGKREAFTHAEHPWVIRCARSNKCGAEHHVKELFSDLFDDWSERYKPTPATPHAAAEAYLTAGRGFSAEKIAGLFTQESYYSNELKEGSATVRFPLAGGAYWERIIDRPWRFGDRKANFRGSYGGTWWAAPGVATAAVERLWLVEGIFDALSLLHHDVAAVSLMSCTNYPSLSLKGLAEQVGDGARPQLVFALDGDKAGAAYTRKFVERAIEEGWDAVAAQIPARGGKKADWNDLHLLGKLTPQAMEEALYHGALLMAKTAGEKAQLMYSHSGRSSFYFRFDNRLFWWKLNLDKFNDAMQALESNEASSLTREEMRDEAMRSAGALSQIGNFWPQILYYQANPLQDEAWYYIRIDFPHDGPAMKNTFTASQLSAAAEFKKRVLHMAPGAMFSGTSGQLDAIIEDQSFAIRVVQTIDFVGYSKEHGAWVFADLAVRGGKVVRLNDEDYFELGKLSIKSLSQSVALAINESEKDFRSDWADLIWQAFGARGIVALSFWFGSFFAEQVRASQSSFPFLEMVGEPGSGKTTLIEFLWKLAGRRDYEGFDPSKSTLAARARNFAQVANLPVVLIEGDREEDAKKGAFDWSELKTAFNGRSTRSRGMKNGGNETYEPPFRGAIVIAQNAPVVAEEAVLSRIVHMHFSKSEHTQEGYRAAKALELYEMAACSGFILRAAQAERLILDTIETRSAHWEQALRERADIRVQRVVKNHAQLMAAVEALAHVIAIPAERTAAAIRLLSAMAAERQQALNADHALVQAFWELYDYIEGDDRGAEQLSVINHLHGSREIAVSLPHFEEICAERRLKLPPLTDLKRVLRTSRRRKFTDVKAVKSVINKHWNAKRQPHQEARSETVWCWVFQS